MELDDFLKNLGLTPTETEIFLATLRTPGFQPASIIANSCSPKRTTVYKTLLNLCKKGIVARTVIKGITCFGIENPKGKIDMLLNKEKEKISNMTNELDDLNKRIDQMRRVLVSPPTIRFYEGLEGIKEVYMDTLKEKATIYAFEDTGDFYPNLKKWLTDTYVPLRTKENIFAKVLAPKSKSNVEYQRNDKHSCRETRFIPKISFPIHNEINIYGNKVAFFSYKDAEMFATIIESKSISNSMRSIFETCWEISSDKK